jgi:hypothetical protein
MVTGLDVGAGQPGERVGEGVGRRKRSRRKRNRDVVVIVVISLEFNNWVWEITGIGSGERFNYYSKIREWGEY